MQALRKRAVGDSMNERFNCIDCIYYNKKTYRCSNQDTWEEVPLEEFHPEQRWYAFKDGKPHYCDSMPNQHGDCFGYQPKLRKRIREWLLSMARK